MLDQRFDPAASEAQIYQRWEEADCFKPSGDTSAEAYSIVIPPPNVTGVLHMGHALNNTLQDILIRYHRMTGKNVLWQPGTDHAGIATQMVVERQMAESGSNESRASLGREAFVERVWEWKEESGGQIIGQLKRLGASCDWSRTAFTMGEDGSDDDQMVRAVRKVFVDLYNDGLIYRAKRLVNWDPHFQTAISDLEVENKEVAGHMWHFKYPLAGGATYTYVEKDEDGNVTLEEERDYISIATTRPETMLGDGAVAVHPSDERYASIVGKLCEIPVGPKEHRRLIPIITDEYPDPDFGSGAVKITGAHDFNDYQVAKRGNIPMYALMDERGAMRSDGAPYAEVAETAGRIARGQESFDEATITAMNLVPDEYRGLDRFEARKQVVADITAEGLAVMVTDEEGNVIPLVEDKKVMQPFGDRSGVVIEPMLTDQWFVDAETLAKPAIEAVKTGKTRFVPENWEKTYFNWMENIQPWCVSRQLWWGHRIPAWFGPTLRDDQVPSGKTPAADRLADDQYAKTIFCAESLAEAIAQAQRYYGDDFHVFCDDSKPSGYSTSHIGGTKPHWVNLSQDPDVLDTWFSSGLWPFSTQGWPDAKGNEDLKTFFPGSVLVTAFDIIFFWVARMMMQGIHFMGEVPFKDVYIHALVLDEKGQKMSKSKGNAIDPLELIDEYGADALRFTMAAMAAQGRNVRLSKQRVEGYRNFSTKLWNAARFCQMNECANWDGALDPATLTQPVNQWIVGELAKTGAEATTAIEEYRFDGAAGAAYRFIWNIFCDWYLELIKPLLNGEDEAAKAETRRTAGWVLDEILKLLHPFMPFVTEALWEQLGEDGPKREGFLMLEAWPSYGDAFGNDAAAEEMDWVIDLVTEVRSVRADLGVSPGSKVPASLVNASETNAARLGRHGEVISRLARLEGLGVVEETPAGAVTTVVDEALLALKIADIIDIGEAKARLTKEIASLEKDVTGIEKKLGNENFVSRAPADVVEENRQRLADGKERLEKLKGAEARLAQL
ncbi:MAG: valine--tRNA ligase [Pseudomonadota bacterium]